VNPLLRSVECPANRGHSRHATERICKGGPQTLRLAQTRVAGKLNLEATTRKSGPTPRLQHNSLFLKVLRARLHRELAGLMTLTEVVVGAFSKPRWAVFKALNPCDRDMT